MEPEFEVNNDKKYEIKEIWDSIVYVKESKKHLSGLYYFVL